MGSGGQYNEDGKPGFDQADTTITATALRVKLSGDYGVTLAGVSDFSDIGVSWQPAQLSGFGTAGGRISVGLYRKQGTLPFTAAGAISQNAFFYRAASGKVAATAVGRPLGIALEATTADGDIFEGLVFADPDPKKIPDPGASGAISVTDSGSCSMTSAGAETRTMANPTFDGQKIALAMDVDGGDIVVTVASAYDQSGHTTVTFNDAGDMVEFTAIRVAGALAWRLVVNNGTTLG